MIHEVERKALYEFLAEVFPKAQPVNGDHEHFRDDTFVIMITNNVISVDLISCFNKLSQMPIHFKVEDRVPPRAYRRFERAIETLKEAKKEAGTFFGEMPGFDDFGDWVLRSAYR